MADFVPPSPKPSPHTILLDDDKNTMLHYSAARGSDEDFTKDLRGTQKLDIENYLGWTPLMMACRKKRISTVKLLLDRGADATKFNKFGLSVFSISVAGGNLEIVTMILEHLLAGGISKRIMQRILSPISIAILFRHHEVLDFLIQQHFDLNAATALTGVTPLMFASAMDDNYAFSLLIKNKADQTIKNHLGETANDIRKARHQKREHQKPKPLKLTPAEMISRSPHMAPNYLFPSSSSMVNLSNGQFLYLGKSPNLLNPTQPIFVTSPITPIPPMGVPGQIFFPQEFSANHYMTFSPMPVSNFFDNGNNLLNLNLSPNQTESLLTPINL